ncbi:hypothetical protein HJC23_010180 [Cyclotella cryptica]|uniref:Uncharacterized protein n=1 Tax=Cyclotella cryptica TaxID=29204 RepID=A0ABD3PLA4_9STRA|eukprot:CCRYP_014702-RA/>CCRYP_014702-RA protein AED:0.29 eAED:0.29 QI:0/-1/0/1/-1/1/1/0/176
MASAAITARKGAAKHGKPSVKTARKYGGKTKDRLTVEQRRRVTEYAKSLKAAPSFHCKSSSEIEVRSYLRPVKGKSREDPTPPASTYVFPATGRTPRKAETGMIGNKTPRDPPSFLKANEDDIGFGDDKGFARKTPLPTKMRCRKTMFKKLIRWKKAHTHVSPRKFARVGTFSSAD